MRTRDGPIFPATPRTTMSPGSSARACTASAVGSLSKSSSWTTVSTMENHLINFANGLAVFGDGLPKFIRIRKATTHCNPIEGSGFNGQNSFTLETPTSQDALNAAQLPKVIDQFGHIGARQYVRFHRRLQGAQGIRLQPTVLE